MGCFYFLFSPEKYPLMNKSHQLTSRFNEVILNGTFIANTNFRHQLAGTDWQLATTPVGSLNSIAQLAQHIHYYINGINQVFSGGSLDIKDKFSFDFPVLTSQQQWDEFLNRFWSDAEVFSGFVEQLTDEKLNEFFTDEKYGTYERNIDAMIEHCYYHLGQIVIIKKMLHQV